MAAHPSTLTQLCAWTGLKLNARKAKKIQMDLKVKGRESIIVMQLKVKVERYVDLTLSQTINELSDDLAILKHTV